MDPYLEDPSRWQDVHHNLIAVLREVLQAALRPRYVVQVEERVYVSDEDEVVALVRPDAAVVEGPQPAKSPPGSQEGRYPTPVLVPTVMASERRERFLTVRLRGEEHPVVTVLEVLSPTNKRGPESEGRQAYLAKRRQVLASSSHLVEIDLLRAGQRVPMLQPLPPAEYYVIVSCAEERPRCRVYPLPLRRPLPAVPIPLDADEEVPLDLQAVLATAYERAAYDLATDYDADPVPPLPNEDTAWARARVAAWRSAPSG